MNFVRTELEKIADEIDCDLYRVISRLESLATKSPVAAPKIRRIARYLQGARPELRELMHPKDVENTV